jgi:hypoxanthine phosphoribosyltransferase
MTTVNVLYNEEAIANRVNELAKDIAEHVNQKDILVVSLLKGSFIFAADLARALHKANLTPQFEFIRASSYGNESISSGKVKILSDIECCVNNREVLLIDDIVDSGRTMKLTRSLFLERGAGKVHTCALLDKPARRAVDCNVDYIGFKVDDVFVVGYGIDYAENYRDLPYIGYVSDAK